MEKKSIVLCNTNIIIEFCKESSNIVDSLKSIGQQYIAVSVVTSGELIYGALNKRELSRIKKNLSNLRDYPLNCVNEDLLLHFINHFPGQR
jgi:tRNA(fMet)-specific endonuclease VapC